MGSPFEPPPDQPALLTAASSHVACAPRASRSPHLVALCRYPRDLPPASALGMPTALAIIDDARALVSAGIGIVGSCNVGCIHACMFMCIHGCMHDLVSS